MARMVTADKDLKDYMAINKLSMISLNNKMYFIPKGMGDLLEGFQTRLKTKKGCLSIINDLYGFQDGAFFNYKGSNQHNYDDDDFFEIALDQLILHFKEGE